MKNSYNEVNSNVTLPGTVTRWINRNVEEESMESAASRAQWEVAKWGIDKMLNDHPVLSEQCTEPFYEATTKGNWGHKLFNQITRRQNEAEATGLQRARACARQSVVEAEVDQYCKLVEEQYNRKELHSTNQWKYLMIKGVVRRSSDKLTENKLRTTRLLR